MIDKAKKYWWIIVLVFAMGGWATMVEIGLASSEKRDKKITEILDRQQVLMEKLSNNQVALTQQVSMMWQLYLKLDDSTLTAWEKLPMYPSMDSSGVRGGATFISVTKDENGMPVVGEKFKFTDSGWYVTKLWDVRK